MISDDESLDMEVFTPRSPPQSAKKRNRSVPANQRIVFDFPVDSINVSDGFDTINDKSAIATIGDVTMHEMSTMMETNQLFCDENSESDSDKLMRTMQVDSIPPKVVKKIEKKMKEDLTYKKLDKKEVSQSENWDFPQVIRDVMLENEKEYIESKEKGDTQDEIFSFDALFSHIKQLPPM